MPHTLFTQRKRVVGTENHAIRAHDFDEELKRAFLEYGGIHVYPIEVVARRKL